MNHFRGGTFFSKISDDFDKRVIWVFFYSSSSMPVCRLRLISSLKLYLSSDHELLGSWLVGALVGMVSWKWGGLLGGHGPHLQANHVCAHSTPLEKKRKKQHFSVFHTLSLYTAAVSQVLVFSLFVFFRFSSWAPVKQPRIIDYLNPKHF